MVKKHARRLCQLCILVSLLAACDSDRSTSPRALYDDKEDALAVKRAEDDLDGKYDLSSRIFLVQYNIARFLETGDKSYANRISEIYEGSGSLTQLPSSSPVIDEVIWLAKYFDAAIILHVNKDHQGAVALLDSYCPQLQYEEKIKCHVENYWHFESQARDGLSRYKQEAAFIADFTLGAAYQDHKMIGRAMELYAEYDIEHATERAMSYATRRSAENDYVMERFCSVPVRYLGWGPGVEDYAIYAAAFGKANCKAYLSEVGLSGDS